MPGDDQLFADPLDFHFSEALPYAEGLDGQQFSPARRLGDVAGRRQFGAVEVAHDLLAAVELRHIGQENGLMDDRSPRALFASHGLDRSQGVVGLLVEGRAGQRRGRGEDMPHVVQIDDRVTHPGMRNLADGMVGHSQSLGARR